MRSAPANIVQLLVAGSQISRPEAPEPDAASTRPSGKVSTVGYQRGSFMFAITVQLSVAGSKMWV
ncbi:hypothetical protein ACG10_22915 (plasmid) [Azotobacter chroococcum]|nr:hypothetical protein ACG10_22915 [Azotobacter chroococcum]